ncbi:MAG: hypothetical protein ACR2PL_05525 [Dehalococcoidia bacterium]
MTTGAVQEFVILTLKFRKERRYWAGECEELGTATDGPSLARVQEELAALVLLHLDGLEQTGERGRFFKEHGIPLYTGDSPLQLERSVPVSHDNDVLLQLRRVPVPSHHPELIEVS